MKRPRGRSQADIQLAATITAAGVKTTGWQIERWRQVGLIPQPAKRWLGRGRGSVSTYSPDAVAQTIEVAKLVRRRRPLEVVVLVLFVRGYPITIESLRNAYRSYFRRIEADIAKSSTGTNTLEVAESLTPKLMRTAARTKVGRSIARRLEQASAGDSDSLPQESSASILQSVVTNLAHVLLEGSAASEDGLLEMFSATGVDAPITDRMGEIGPIAPDHALAAQKAILQEMSLAKILDRLDRTSLRDFEQSRDFVKRVSDFAPALAGFVRAIAGPRDAFGFGPIADMIRDDLNIAQAAAIWLPMLPLIESADGQLVSALMVKNQQRYADAFADVTKLPRELQRNFRDPVRLAAGVEALPDQQKEDVRRRAEAFLAKYGSEDMNQQQSDG